MYLKHITASASLLKVHVIDRIKSLLFYNLVELQIHKWIDTHWLNFFILCNLFHCQKSLSLYQIARWAKYLPF